MDVELLENVLEVGVDSIVAQVEIVGDFHRREPGGDTLEDVSLPSREMIRVLLTLPEEGLHDFLGDHRVERGSPLLNFLDSVDDVGGGGGFQKVAGSSTIHRRPDVLIQIIRSEHDDVRRRRDPVYG